MGCERIYGIIKKQCLHTGTFVAAASLRGVLEIFYAFHIRLDVRLVCEKDPCGKNESSPLKRRSAKFSSRNLYLPQESKVRSAANEASMPTKMTNATAELN